MMIIGSRVQKNKFANYKYKRIVAIDPGFSGAVACLDLDTNNNVIAHYADYFPTEVKKVGKANRTYYELTTLKSLIRNYANIICFDVDIVIEHSQSMPHDGRVQAFAFGYSFGLLHGLCLSLRDNITLVKPNVWKKVFVEKGADKEASRLKAIELFPQMADKLKLKKSHGLAEALLIAEWQRRKLLNE